MRKRCLVLFFAAAIRAEAADFNASARGTTSAEFLTLGVGARAVSMGEAYSAATDEASALYWNPAALSRIQNRSVTFMHAAYVDSSFFNYGAYGQNLGKRGAFGIGFQYFSAGAIRQTDATGTELGSFTPYDLALSLGYAYKFQRIGPLDGFSLGLAGKFIRSTILNTAQTGAVDAGILSPNYFNGRLRLALTAVNLGGALKFEQVSEELPTALRLGSAYKIKDTWLASLDASFPRSDNPYVALGMEYGLINGEDWTFAGRAGFNSQTLGSIDGFTGISFGVGINCRGYAMDYGFVPLGGIGQAHRVSFTYRF